MFKYKLRAECMHDLEQFYYRAKSYGKIQISWANTTVKYKFYSPLNYEELQTIIKSIPNGHVMARSLKALSTNKI